MLRQKACLTVMRRKKSTGAERRLTCCVKECRSIPREPHKGGK
uniref:Uncharacterized protein n=1 Tax=Picea sitchensis TaxID=3332 RepID=A9NMV3_PICSI|nr:unknown [Picea sitchensis]